MIKLFDPIVSKEEEKALIDTFRSHWWASGEGINSVYNFEQKINRTNLYIINLFLKFIVIYNYNK